MPKRAEGLTAAGVKAAKAGVHVDGAGLMLVVAESGAAKWTFRYQLSGKRRDMGLGPARGPGAVTLADARETVANLRRMLREGVDPIAKRDADAAAERAKAEAEAREAARLVRTFRHAADAYLAAHEGGWRNAKHRAQWAMTLREYAGPHIGDMPVGDVDTQHVEAVLRPLWHAKPETASRLRGRIEAVLDYATVQKWRSGANPARWRGHLDKLFPRRSKVRAVEHHAALPWQDTAAFVAALRQRDAIAARAMEFTILTAARSGEVLGMRWSEVDLDAAVWIVPGKRMKAGREHRVPLSPPALAILRDMLPLRAVAGEADPVVFPGQRRGQPLSIMAMAMVLRRMGRGDLTVHGFRSTFRDWSGEATSHPGDVVEMALAHTIGSKVEAAYRRGDMFAKRRRLMDDWAEFCAKAPAEVRVLRPLPVTA